MIWLDIPRAKDLKSFVELTTNTAKRQVFSKEI